MLMSALERLRKIYAAERDKQAADSLKEVISGLENAIKTLTDVGFNEPAVKKPVKPKGDDSALDPQSKLLVSLAASAAVRDRNQKREEEERKRH